MRPLTSRPPIYKRPSEPRRPRIGVLGGSFDPIHNAHLMIAGVAIQHLSLDVLHFVPTRQQPMKPPHHASAEHRLRMVRLAAGGIRGFVVDDQELRRPGPSYTVDTVRQIVEQVADAQVHVLIGTDMIAGLEEWHEIDELCRLATLVSIRRDDSPRPKLKEGRITLQVPMPVIPISSSQIRERARKRKYLAGWVPSLVADYIVAEQLYQGNSWE